MIARIWTTGVDPDRLDEYEAFARDISLPMFRAMPGCEGVVMYRSGSQCHVLTLWRSLADIEALDRSDRYRRTVERIVATGFIVGDQATIMHDAHLAWMAPSADGEGCATP